MCAHKTLTFKRQSVYQCAQIYINDLLWIALKMYTFSHSLYPIYPSFELYNPMRQNNFAQEILTYGRSDVDILRRCCLEFRQLFCKFTDIDPFEKSLTIASACNMVFRTNYLETDTIAVIPPQGYKERKQSILARKWLSHTAENQYILIQQAYKCGEVRVGPYYLDR